MSGSTGTGCRWAVAAAVLALAAGGAARAEEGVLIGTGPTSAGTNWSATAGETVGRNNGVVQGEVGWPGVSVTYLKGSDERSDIGGRASFLYGFENTTSTAGGFGLNGIYRRRLNDDPRLAISGHIDPGVEIYGVGGTTVFGLTAPVGVVAGYKLDDRLTIDAGADVPITIALSGAAGVVFGPLIGVGGEYKVNRDMAVTFRTRVGPEFAVVSGGSGSSVGFVTLLGLAYNTR